MENAVSVVGVVGSPVSLVRPEVNAVSMVRNHGNAVPIVRDQPPCAVFTMLCVVGG